MKKFLFIIQQLPFSTSKSLETLELALGLAAFEQKITLIFMRDGVLQLLNKQNPATIFYKDFTKVFAGLNLFSITDVYIEQSALNKYALNANIMSITPKPLSDEQIADLITNHDIILSF